MMFLIRTAFWLLILVLLLPANEDEQNQIYGTAQAAMNDVVGFCDRNPQTCATSEDAFHLLVQKAQYGAQMLMAMVERQTGSFSGGIPGPYAPGTSEPVAIPGEGSVMPVPDAVPLEPATWDTPGSQDTLSQQDREAAWGGPGV